MQREPLQTANDTNHWFIFTQTPRTLKHRLTVNHAYPKGYCCDHLGVIEVA